MFLEIAVLHKHGASVAVTARLSYPAVKGTGYSNSHTPLPTSLLFFLSCTCKRVIRLQSACAAWGE